METAPQHDAATRHRGGEGWPNVRTVKQFNLSFINMSANIQIFVPFGVILSAHVGPGLVPLWKSIFIRFCSVVDLHTEPVSFLCGTMAGRPRVAEECGSGNCSQGWPELWRSVLLLITELIYFVVCKVFLKIQPQVSFLGVWGPIRSIQGHGLIVWPFPKTCGNFNMISFVYLAVTNRRSGK